LCGRQPIYHFGKNEIISTINCGRPNMKVHTVNLQHGCVVSKTHMLLFLIILWLHKRLPCYI